MESASFLTTGSIWLVLSTASLNHFATPPAPPGLDRLSAIFFSESAHFLISPVPDFMPAPMIDPRIRAASHSSLPHRLKASVMCLTDRWPRGDAVHFSKRSVNA